MPIEKLAQATLFKLLGKAVGGFAPKLKAFAEVGEKGFAGGWDAGMKALSPYASQSFTKAKVGMSATEHTPGWLSSGIADSFKFIDAAKKGGIEGAGKYLGKQVSDARFKTVDLNAKSMFGKSRVVSENGKKFIEGKGLFQNKMFRREILGTDATGKPIIKKRLLSQAGAISMTPIGMAGVGLATPGDTRRDITDSALWAAARPVAEVKMFAGMF